MRARTAGKLPVFLLLSLSLLALALSSPPSARAAQPGYKINTEDFSGQQGNELKAREEALKISEQRLLALKKDVDQRIARYQNLLARVQDALKLYQAASNQGIQRLVKVYETMPPGNTAQAISGLELATAVKIMLMMKPRKAAAVMAQMSPEKAQAISNGMLGIGKKIPIR